MFCDTGIVPETVSGACFPCSFKRQRSFVDVFHFDSCAYISQLLMLYPENASCFLLDWRPKGETYWSRDEKSSTLAGEATGIHAERQQADMMGEDCEMFFRENQVWAPIPVLLQYVEYLFNNHIAVALCKFQFKDLRDSYRKKFIAQ